MLELKNITKIYTSGDNKVYALKGIDLAFRHSEFVSILGPSGCGKTTMLNIVGGLDRYTEGDLIINNRSTKDFKPYDWDAYRNKSIGFVFQSYNLIPHLTVLGNVELALTLTGESKEIRRTKAAAALEKVGLSDQVHKRPNQLSGGQMQRVAIARAIVNDPEIILADEPTGALDSKTSIQITDLLKEIAKDRLVIMVTHNDEIANKYSTRLIRLLDGVAISDSHPYTEEELNKDKEILAEKEKQADTIKPLDTKNMQEAERKAEEARVKKLTKLKEKEKRRERRRTSMNYVTALSLSGKNLATKKGRTFLVSFAGSIGIIGIALVLAISNGFSLYISRMQSDTLVGFPLSITQSAMDMSSMTAQMGGNKNDLPQYPDSKDVTVYAPSSKMMHFNNITDDYISYVEKLDKSYYNELSYTYSNNMPILRKNSTGVVSLVEKSASAGMGSSSVWQEMPNNKQFLESQYSLLDGKVPSAKDEIAIVIDKYNRISTTVTNALKLDISAGTIKTADFIGEEFKIVNNNVYYKLNDNGKTYSAQTDFASMYDNESNITLKVVGVLRVSELAPLDLFNPGFIYTPALTKEFVTINDKSDIALAQRADPSSTVVTFKLNGTSIPAGSPIPVSIPIPGFGITMTRDQFVAEVLKSVGAVTKASEIYIYPKDFESKTKINEYLDAYNVGKTEEQKIMYMDMSALLADTMGSMIDIISYVLIAFAAVSLVVSCIMIGIITYVSVIERTKEIGVLRSIGARKKDISRVFNAETLIIGFAAGLLGVVVSLVLTVPINLIISAVISANGVNPATIGNLAVVNPISSIALIVISMVLTLISGLIPSRVAAKKDPVEALRSE